MRQKTNTVVGIDIGTGSVTTAVGLVAAEGLEVLGVGRVPSKGLRKGVVIQIDATVDSIKASVAEAERMSGVKVDNAVVSISGNHIQGIISSGMTPIKGKEVTLFDVERVIEAAQAVPLPANYEVIHLLPQEFIVDGQNGIKDPIGMSGVRLEARAYLIVANSSSLQNVVKCVNRAGISVKDIVASSLASMRAVLTAEEQELGACVIDIGSGTTDICAVQAGAIKLLEVLPIGGNHLTNDIAAGLRAPFSSADKIKVQSGTAVYTEIGRNETIEVASLGEREPRVLSRNLLAEILEPRIIEIFSLVRQKLAENAPNVAQSGIVLTGGQSGLHGILKAAEKVFNLPVRIGKPLVSKGVTELVGKAEFSTAIGLLLSQELSHPLFRKELNADSGVLKRVSGWFSKHL